MFTLSHARTLEAPCRPTVPPEEPAEHESALVDPSLDAIDHVQAADPLHNKQIIHIDLLNTELLDPECEAVLETMDSCVGCVEGVDEQHVYEEKMIEHAIHRKAAVEQHGLSEAEAAMIRLNIMEEERDDMDKQNHDSVIPDLDILNLCGNDDDLEDAHETFLIPPTQEVMSCADIVDEELILETRKDTEVRDGIVIGQDINALQCAICFDEALTGGNVSLNRVKFANLPCCGAQEYGSSATFIKVCTSCILVLTSPSSSGAHRVGRCPRCLNWIRVKIPEPAERNVVSVEKVHVSGKCLICNQNKDYLVDNDSVCDSCFLGRRQPLKYECQQCHCVQKIPHPMYRYQKTKDAFGNVTWACQGKCGRFTKWMIRPEEVHRIPLGDAPKSWGTDYIKIARDRVQILRQDLVGDSSKKAQNALTSSGIDEEDPSQCLIL
ncbi:expressed unknown protein [Seminavis robusta]|uniref:Uncharacterized protein n=1 Tax=Seminavis robusta TaxID=568900 RepID=A0A9N8D9M2_9STRA|nr:expressed unknown protein [Seminavis robusta]|eukprot:Sro47_g027820.1 n/a (437) ;mRNA; f:72889-74199